VEVGGVLQRQGEDEGGQAQLAPKRGRRCRTWRQLSPVKVSRRWWRRLLSLDKKQGGRERKL
jgi:hypothetical protein